MEMSGFERWLAKEIGDTRNALMQHDFSGETLLPPVLAVEMRARFKTLVECYNRYQLALVMPDIMTGTHHLEALDRAQTRPMSPD